MGMGISGVCLRKRECVRVRVRVRVCVCGIMHPLLRTCKATMAAIKAYIYDRRDMFPTSGT